MSNNKKIFGCFKERPGEYYKQVCQQDEILLGASAVRTGLVGLHGKLVELQKRLEKERNEKYPDQLLIKRIEDKISQIAGILNNAANYHKVQQKVPQRVR